MLKNHIKIAHEWNKRELENVSGIRFYYSKGKTGVTFAIWTLMLLSFILLISTKAFNEGLMVFLIIVSLMILYSINRLLGILILKQPIFILNQKKLYYLKTDQWYDLDTHIFENKVRGRHNYYLTFFVKDKNGNELLTENNWFLRDEDRLMSAIKYWQIQNKIN